MRVEQGSRVIFVNLLSKDLFFFNPKQQRWESELIIQYSPIKPPTQAKYVVTSHVQTEVKKYPKTKP